MRRIVECKPCSKEVIPNHPYDPGRTRTEPALYQYNQLAPMCERHFLAMVESIERICHTKIDISKYKL